MMWVLFVAAVAVLSCNQKTSQTTPEDQIDLGIDGIEWFAREAENGNIFAQFELATIYDLHYAGWGIERNTQEAMKWYKMAAEKGHERAQANLANLLVQEKDYNEALKWYKMVAQKGNPFGQFGLGFMYLNHCCPR